MSEQVPEGIGPGRFSLDDLIALNDEIAALARAGMPLERGLLDLGRDVPGRLGAMTTALGERMSRGEGLAEAIGAQGDRLPPMYRAVVEAGIRSGRLPVALEGLAGVARRVAETRSVVGLALAYPLLVLSLAYVLFLGILTQFVPRLLATSETFRLPNRGPLLWLAWLGDSAIYWGPIVPIAVAAIGVSWVRSGWAAGLQPGRSSTLRLVPWMGSMLALSEAATFADLLALLVEHRVAYPEAIVLASSTSADPALRRAGLEFAVAVGRGDSPRAFLARPGPFPPLLRWLLSIGERQGSIETALKHAAQTYRTRAAHRAELIATFLPVLLTVAIGGLVTLLYALTLFVPLTALLKGLSS